MFIWNLLFTLKYRLEDFLKKPNRVLVGSNTPVIPGSDSWEILADIPTYHYEFGGTYLNGKIYTLGGLYQPSVYHVLKNLESYEVEKKEWARLKDYPYIIHHPCLTTVNNKIYVVGGNGLRITPYSYVHAYDPSTNTWERCADMPTPRGALGITTLDGLIYAVGGGANKVASDSIDVYDPKTNVWRTLAPMPTAREHLAVATAGGKIFALGGYTKSLSECLNINEMYDPKTNTWETKAPLPLNISGFFACGLGDSIYIFGGEQGWAVSGEVHEYKVKEDKWYRHKDMPTKRYACIAVPVGNEIHVIGGNSILKGNRFSLAHEVYHPDI